MSAKTQPLDPGALSIRMQVLVPTTTSDGMGGGTRSMVAERKVWARFEPKAPAQHETDPTDDRYARGTVTVRLSQAPATGAHLQWTQFGTERTVIVEAVEPGTANYPFDRCAVRETLREDSP
ncbi:MAG: hypothetical protein KI785_11160 [Devosiaceae bacterium]|nr:hypothetical protein [Devosiaceae bacterium MH13]